MEPADAIALIFGVVMAVIAVAAAVIAWVARGHSKRSADAAEGSLQISRSMRMLTAESVRMQAEQHDDALKPDFVATPDDASYEFDGKTAWRIVMRVTHGPPKARLRWATTAEAKGPQEGGGRPIYPVAGPVVGPFDANIGDEFGAHVEFPLRLDVVEVSATITVWSEEVEHDTGRPTGRRWTPWVQTIHFGQELPPPKKSKIIV